MEAIVQAGVKSVCISPGARCAPLAVAAQRHPALRCIFHYDERGAAYFALGTARRQGHPSALICTSGTAVANYLPAIVEACYNHVPIIALTADRPPEHIGIGANQAIHQADIFGVFVSAAMTLPCPSPDLTQSALHQLVVQTITASQALCAGPVHINCPFHEPLLGRETGEVDTQEQSSPEDTPVTSPSAPSVKAFADAAADAQDTGVIVVGGLRNPEGGEAALRLAQHLGWPLLPDITSGLRMREHPLIVQHDDLLLSMPRYQEQLTPHTVLHLGERIVSKRLIQHLQAHPPVRHFQVHPHSDPIEPWFPETQFIRTQPAVFCQAALACIPMQKQNENKFLSPVKQASNEVAALLDSALSGDGPLTEPYVCRRVSSQPGLDSLFLGNSMPVRDMDAFASSRDTPVRAYANRGASGIDGSIATFAGIASVADGPCLAVIGDLACLHDMNSLRLLHAAPHLPVLVVLNNDGGGIFHFLPLDTAGDAFEPCFGAPHGLTFEKVARQFNVDYFAPKDAAELDAALNAQRKNPVLIEAQTNRIANHRVHQDLLAHLATYVA